MDKKFIDYSISDEMTELIGKYTDNFEDMKDWKRTFDMKKKRKDFNL